MDMRHRGQEASPPDDQASGNIAHMPSPLSSLSAQAGRQRTGHSRRRPNITNVNSTASFSSVFENWALVGRMREQLSNLQQGLALIEDRLASTADSTMSEEAILQQSQNSVASLEEDVDIILEGVPVSSRPTPSSAAKATQLFDVAELLEKTLLKCEFVDLLQARQVNCTFAASIASSSKIQQFMGTQAALEGSELFSPLANSYFISRGLFVHLEDQHCYGLHIEEDEVVVVVSIFHGNDKAHQRFQNLNQRFRSLLVCQPPIREMRVRADCCNDPVFRRRPPGVTAQSLSGRPPDRESDLQALPAITSETGIALGDIVDKLAVVRQEHLYCPDAHQGLHRDDGTVDMTIHFEAILKLNENDPRLIARRERRAKAQREQRVLQEKDARMRAYIAAKQSARNNGEAIPTLGDFETEQERARQASAAV